MKSTIERTLTNPWVLWSLFGAGFFLPYLFVIFLPSISMIAWKHIRSEYKDTTEFWIEYSNSKQIDTKKDQNNNKSHTKPSIPALSPVPLS